jgi:hypothetical protein
MVFECMDNEMPLASPFTQPLSQFVHLTRIVTQQVCHHSMCVSWVVR